MKKVFLFLIVGIFVLSGVSFAASTTFDSDGGHGSGILNSFKTSKNVTIICSSSAATYAAVASHLNGSAVYGSAAGDSVIYKLKAGKTAGTAYTTAPSASDSSCFDSTWESL